MTRPTQRTVRVHGLVIPVQRDAQPEAAIARQLRRRFGVTASASRVVRRSLDSRRLDPRYVYTVELTVPERTARRLLNAGHAEDVRRRPDHRYALRRPHEGPAPVVVGAGPAGLFAALTLAEAGAAPMVIERGRPVGPRARDVSALYARGRLSADSNVCYGEGGAGTFSDGKLYTRVGDPRTRRVLRELVRYGAREDILVAGRPHVGTDKLIAILERLRARLLSLGAQVRFETALDALELVDGQVRGATLRDGERVQTRHLVLATGHSAREVWESLAQAGVGLEARAFAVGFRVEHPQPLIDALRYGRKAQGYGLPAADYRLTHNQRGGDRRGVYSFCMCPGGVVVPTPTQPNRLCINGMSHASRSGRFANSALVATVTPEDFANFGDLATGGLFGGADFQARVEARAFEAGGGAFAAPAARLTDFLSGRPGGELGSTSYRRGLTPADLSALYPQRVIEALKEGIAAFERSMPGFVTEEAKLIGVETRTASPIRVPRGDDMQAHGVRGLFPAGEGMGYGGGIVSAALDGIRCAETLLQSLGAERHEVDEDGRGERI